MKLLILFLFISGSILGQITFDPEFIDNDPATANAANTVTTGDFDGDGDMDVIGGSFISDYYSIYFNDGTGTFTRNTIDNGATADGARYVTAFDLDQDGDLDILAASSVANAYLWYENDGSGLFISHVIDSSILADEAYTIAGGDFDDDGDMDVVCGAFGGDSLSWFSNDGNENFTLNTVLDNSSDLSNGVRLVRVSDLDEDGDPDIVVAAFVGDTYSWWENDGNGIFTPHTIDATINADGATAFDIADLDGDGDLDIAAGSNDANQFLWYENDGSESFTPNIIDNTSDYSIGPRGLVLTDLEQDGDMDIITAAVTGDAFAWYENDGSGNFTGDVIDDSATYANGAFAVAVGDMDGDMVDDVIGAANISDAFIYFRTEGVVILEDSGVNSSAFKVYPNPTSDILQISSETELVSATVLDYRGRIVLEYQLEGINSPINVSSLTAGVYILKLESANAVSDIKFVKR